MSTGFLPYGRHAIGEDDIAAVAEVLRGDWLTTGPNVAAFEADFAAAVGARHALACNSGTAALHMAAHALRLGPDDAVVVPAITFLATANAAVYVGAEVVFADVDAETGAITPETVREAARRATRPVKAVFPVHLKGTVADPPAIAEAAEALGAVVVEDACHGLGTIYTANGTPARVGACAHATIATFSLHPVKTIAMGEGGVVTTNDPALAETMRRFRSHGMVHAPEAWALPDQGMEDGAPAPWYYEMQEPGFNYRAPDIACALARSQLGKLEGFVARRAALADRYDALLAPLAPHVLPPVRPEGCTPGWHLYAVRIDFAACGRRRGAVMRALRERGIGSQVHYVPVPWQPYWRNRQPVPALPGAEHYYARTLSLPLYPGMDDGDPTRVVTALAEVLGIG
ncbi:UDP-4-amino-4,6-dideoxy-N-acetyl-beta-L-altrosamine transaminase [Elioraea sp.]|uniref:UDP-4-amino-4, 6-dideoxy-N-acetyl-beta-L-altrosamine transaminase n=1 Tax=Elioraea sp. TaxID=2185103 RepID=UPI0025BA3093|nr:UDP-4-amino-4,6-dideoxy-N-acetyl-beta-L-altrosamine transaminase [Elioraea sp.]